VKPSVYVASQKHRATSRGHQWTLTDDQAKDLVTQKCFYCGAEPFEGCGGIDRTDNEKGYVPGNCVPSCGYCNMMKGTLGKSEFLSRVGQIHVHQHRR
jgi:hypothetical protein